MLNSSSKSENMSKLVGFSLLKSFQRGRNKEIKSRPKKGKEKKKPFRMLTVCDQYD